MKDLGLAYKLTYDTKILLIVFGKSLSFIVVVIKFMNIG